MYLTQERFSKILTVPLSLPQTQIRRYDTETLGSISIELGQRLRFRWAAGHVVRSGVGSQGKVNSAFGLAYMGLYLNSFGYPAGVPIALLDMDTEGVHRTNHFRSWEVSTPGFYEILITNNLIESDLEVVATAILQLEVE